MIETYCRTCQKPMTVRNSKELREAEKNVRICEKCFDAFDGLTIDEMIEKPAAKPGDKHG